MSLFLPAIWASPAHSVTETDVIGAPCKQVEVVFVRGSGEVLSDANRSFVKFEQEFTARMDGGTERVNYYELGEAAIGGSQYPAVGVGTGDWDSFTNTVGAKVGSGGAFEYGDSVNKGVGELDNYLTKRSAACDAQGVDFAFVLVGYSQGAQVVGEAYNEKLTDAMRNRVLFNALFGDPKLHLPEGERRWYRDGLIPSYYAKACQDEEANASPWRRNVPDCETDNGSLGARDPYLPAGFQNTTGLWCANDDFVCGSSKNVFVNNGHFGYFNEGGDVQDAAIEIAERLQERFTADSDNFDVTLYPVAAGSTGLDVAFVIDSTGSMSGAIAGAKAYAATMAEAIGSLNGRVALVEYRDSGDIFTSRILTGLTEDTGVFEAQLSTMFASGGGDTPEATLHALKTAFNGLDWRPGATKAAVVLTDATFHNPDRVDGSTVESIAQRSLEIDPVNVYPVVPQYLSAAYSELASKTSGQVIVNDGNASAALTEALSRISARPVPILSLFEYKAPVGEPVVFDASRSYSPNSTIVKWDWDFNGDGVYEETTTAPRTTHTYSEEFDGLMQARATDANGLIANISAPVQIGNLIPPSHPAAPTSVEAELVDGALTVTWEGDQSLVHRWIVTLDGMPAAGHDADARTITIPGVEITEPLEVGVLGVMENGDIGDRTSVIVQPPDLVQTVEVDIMPGGPSTSTVKLTAKGSVAVAVLGTAEFDVATIDPDTVCFGSATTADERDCTEEHQTAHKEDSNKDGILDLVFHFSRQQSGLKAGDTTGCAAGQLIDGGKFEGCDSIRVIK